MDRDSEVDIHRKRDKSTHQNKDEKRNRPKTDPQLGIF